MEELKLKQLEFEIGTWRRLLSFMIDENIYLKNRLSEILKTPFDKKLLEAIENFHNRFIKQDDLNNLLRNEMSEFNKLLIKEIFVDGKVISEVSRKFKNMRNSIMNANEHFGKIQFEFNSFLSTMVYDHNRKSHSPVE